MNPPPIPARDPRSPAAAPMDMDLRGMTLLSEEDFEVEVEVEVEDDGDGDDSFGFSSFFFCAPVFGLDDDVCLVVCLPVDLILP